MECNYIKGEYCDGCPDRFECWTKVVPMKPIPNYGNLFTLSDFVKQCREGSFIDYDGIGHYASKDMMSYIDVRPSDVRNIDYHWTHVVWFNR